jgi:hypothetical protein
MVTHNHLKLPIPRWTNGDGNAKTQFFGQASTVKANESNGFVAIDFRVRDEWTLQSRHCNGAAKSTQILKRDRHYENV